MAKKSGLKAIIILIVGTLIWRYFLFPVSESVLWPETDESIFMDGSTLEFDSGIFEQSKTILLGAFVSWVIIFFVVKSGYDWRLENSSNSIFPETPHIADSMHAKIIVSLCHSTISTIGSSITLACDWWNLRSYTTNGNMHEFFKVGFPHTFVIAITFAFFIWDIVFEIYYCKLLGLEYLVHAFFGVVLTFFGFIGIGQQFSMYLIVTEASTIFLQISWILKRRAKLAHKEKNPKTPTWLLLTFIFLFMLTRLVMYPIILKYIYREFLIPFRSVASNRVASVLGQFAPQSYILSPIIYYISLVATYLMFIVNFRWGTLMVLKLLSKLL
jgi:hypothetical protein